MMALELLHHDSEAVPALILTLALALAFAERPVPLVVLVLVELPEEFDASELAVACAPVNHGMAVTTPHSTAITRVPSSQYKSGAKKH